MIIKYSQLKDLRSRTGGRTLVLGGGSFDLMHFGHIQYIQRLAYYGEVAVVAVKCDEAIAKEKGHRRPIIPEMDRLRMVDAIKGVSYSFLVPLGVGFVEMNQEFQPDCIMTCNPRWSRYKELDLVRVTEPRFNGGHYMSTSAIIQRIDTDY